MPLIKKDNSAPATTAASNAAKTAAKFESAPEDTGADEQHEQDTTVAETTNETPKAAVRESREVAVPKTTAVGSTRSTKLVNVLEDLKDSLKVDYNTLPNLQINQGNWLLREGKKPLGDVVDFELLSYQDQWVISPGTDGDEAAEFVRYSNDGVTTSMGENCNDYVNQLHNADYPNAAMKQRCVLVLNLLAVSKKGNEALLDTLYQVDLPPSSKSKFDAYRAQASFHVARGKKTADQAVVMKSSVSVVSKGNNSWSVADFTYSELTV